MAAGWFSIGAVVGGRYQIEEEIGRGGSAVVYGARDRQVKTPVALKVLMPPPALAGTIRERTRREILAVRALAHPAVVPIFDLIEEGPALILVMEWVRGSDLEAMITERGPLPVDQIAAIGCAVADALSTAHRRGVLHRDVKPRNILIDTTGRARLTDFGSARVEGQETLTHTGAIVGTLDYAGPEVVAGRRGDARADVHALGMTLYLATTGRLPTRGPPHLPPTPVENGHRPRDLRPDTPAWLDAIVMRATAADPRRRFPTMAGLAEALSSRALPPLPDLRPSAGRVDFCLSCGVPEPLGAMVCVRCGGPPVDAGNTWLVATAPNAGPERRGLAARLATLCGLPLGHAGAAEAASGRRVLARFPAALAEKASAQLATRGVPTTLVPTRRDWKLIPAPLYLLTAAVGLVGIAAGVSSPFLMFASPPMAGALLLLGHSGVKRPLLDRSSNRRLDPLPAPLLREVASALEKLPDGEARLLLADVVRLARALFGVGMGASGLTDDVIALVQTACHAALSLGRVEDAMSTLSQRPSRNALESEGETVWFDRRARLEGTHSMLVQHLLDAIAALGDILSHAAQPDPDLLERLGRRSREIEDDLRLRAQADAEVAALLGESA